MILVREYMPNGMPLLIQGEVTETDDTSTMDVSTVRINPISPDGVVLPKLPDGDLDDDFVIACAIRLTRMFTEENN